MAKKEIPAGPKLEEITANRLRIERGSLIAGNISFQIRNIASLLIDRNDNGSSARSTAIGIALASGAIGAAVTQNAAGFFIVAFIAFIAAYFLLKKDWYELKLLTNAASSFKLINEDEKFLAQMKSAIEAAMQDPESAVYNINVEEHKIDRIDASTHTISNSNVGNYVGGDAKKVTQHATVTVSEGLSDISQLLALVQNTDAENASLLKSQLEIVRMHIAGGNRTRDEAKTAWSKFLEHVGSLAQAGNHVWDLVSRIGILLAA